MVKIIGWLCDPDANAEAWNDATVDGFKVEVALVTNWDREILANNCWIWIGTEADVLVVNCTGICLASESKEDIGVFVVGPQKFSMYTFYINCFVKSP